MAIAKITSSGKGLLFVDDEGNTFITSVSNFQRLLAGEINCGFVLFQRMPTKVPQGKFNISPLYTPKDNTMRTMGEADPMAAMRKKDEEGKYEDKILL